MATVVGNRHSEPSSNLDEAVYIFHIANTLNVNIYKIDYKYHINISNSDRLKRDPIFGEFSLI